VAFVQAAIPKMRQVDTELPMVPPKDLYVTSRAPYAVCN
jgi:hypothetical protein